MLVFLLARRFHHVLRDLRPIFLGGGDGHLHRILLILPRDGQHVLIGGGRVQHQLPLHGRSLDDLRHVLDKAHIEHLVRFVQHHRVDGVEADVAAVHVIQQAAGRCDDDLRVAAQLVDLPRDRLSAVDHGNAQPINKLGQMAQLLGDLQRQLARRCEHELLHPTILEVDVFQHRDAERQRFAGTGRRNRDHVAALHHQRQRLLLHGRHLRDAHFLQRLEHLRADIRLGKDGIFVCFCCQNCELLTFEDTVQWRGKADRGRTSRPDRECRAADA